MPMHNPVKDRIAPSGQGPWPPLKANQRLIKGQIKTY